MKDLKQADRGTSMKQQYRITDFPKSGFPLVYNSHVGGLVMGRMYPASYQYIMSGDKFAGRNEFSLIAEKLSTPVVSDVHVSQHNYFVTLRSIDRGFEELQTPTKNNSMSANISTPQFKLCDVVLELIGQFADFLPFTIYNSLDRSGDIVINPNFGFTVGQIEYWKMNAGLRTEMAKSYIDDALDDLCAQLKTFKSAYDALSGTSTQEEIYNFYIRVWCTIFDFFCGEGSLMDYFGYPIMKHEDVDVWLHQVLTAVSSSVTSDIRLDNALLESNDFIDFHNTQNGVDNRLVWEYPLRAYYAIWFEHYRNMWLEPRTSDLWEYKDWGSTPLLSGSTLLQAIATLLVTRIRPWTDDPFNTSQIDDMARHVYAPVLSPSGPTNYQSEYSQNPSPAQSSVNGINMLKTGNLWSSLVISYSDLNGSRQNVTCPIPDALSGMDIDYSRFAVNSSFGNLDLFTLKKAKMLENFLKRNLAFGDEYRDRVKAQYGVTIEDYRINRPHYLSGSVDSVDIKQEVANGAMLASDSVDPSFGMNSAHYLRQGDRVATGTAASGVSDGFEFFATEFGIYINILSIIPMAQYDHTCPILFTQKMQDFPIPAFAMQQEDINNTSEIYRLGVYNKNYDNKPFGHVPYAHGWRYRIDEVHGQMLSSKFDYTFARFYQGLTSDGVPKLNYQFIHCRPNLPMFVNSILLDGQFYGTLKHNFLAERTLPQPVETI